MEHSNNHPHFDPAHIRSPIEPAHKGRAQRLVEIAERLGIVRSLRGLHDRRNPALMILAYHRVTPTDAFDSSDAPLCQGSCRLDSSVILGILRNDSGSVPQRIQRAGGGAAAPA